MRVLFASTRLSGGAGIACRRIWESFREQNRAEVSTLAYRENANLWTRQYNKATGQTLRQEIYKHHSEWTEEHLSKNLNEERSSFSATYLSALELEGPYDQFMIDLFDAHDIVNIHWTSGLLTIKSLQHLADTGKPVIITMHDQKHFTGACHYSAGCRQFTSLCTGCPQLQTERAQLLAEQQHRIKHSILASPNFYWTGPSEWIVKEAARSGMPFSSQNLLPPLKNPVVDDSTCIPEEVEKITLSFQSSKRKVALVADDLNDPRKGILLGVHALAMAVATSQHLKEGIELHLVGSTDGSEVRIRELINQPNNGKTPHAKIDVVSHGRVPSHHLAVILQLVDLLVFPSIEENYSNLLIETLQAGTPVAAFAVGGNCEIARDYPELMKVVGGRLNIVNGINGNDNARLEHIVKLLAKAVRDQLNEKEINPHKSAIERCKLNHNRSHVADSYLLAMSSILSSHQHPPDSNVRKDRRDYQMRSHRVRVHQRRNRQRMINSSEPVFWLSTKNDWPVEVADGHMLLTLALKPSWDADFISNKLVTEHWSWIEIPLFSHDKYQIPELQYWDCVALLATSGGDDRPSSATLLRSVDEADNGIPVLLQSVIHIPSSEREKWSTLSDLLWQCIRGECIVSPMKGLSNYPTTVPFAAPLDVSKAIRLRPKPRARILLSSIEHRQINVEEPVYWLGRDSFNDITLDSEGFLVGCALYPSWDSDYLPTILSDQAEAQIIHEIPHTIAHVPELRYWNTVVLSITSQGACHLFSDHADEVHALPILYMGYGHHAGIYPSLTPLRLGSITEAATTLIPPMAGFRYIVSSLR